MNQAYERSRKSLDLKALGVNMPEPNETAKRKDLKDLDAAEFADLLQDLAGKPLYLPDSSAPPVTDEARELLLAKYRGALPEVQAAELQDLIDRYRSWHDTYDQIRLAEMRHQLTLGIPDLVDQIHDSIFGDPLSLTEEAELCRRIMRLTGQEAKQVVDEHYRNTPAEGRIPDLQRLLAEDSAST
jgi:hypothetical protein